MLEKNKDPFLKTVADACQIISGWHNVYRNSPKYIEANDGVTFVTTGTTEDPLIKNKKDKKKNITCFKCKKVVTIRTNVLMMVKKKARTGQAF